MSTSENESGNNSSGDETSSESPAAEDEASKGSLEAEDGRKSLRRRFKDLSKIVQAIVGLAAAVVAIAGAVTAGITVKNWLFPHHPPVSQVLRTPVLGMQFWQNNSLAPMSSSPQGTTDVVTVSLKATPFEIWLPAVSNTMAYEVSTLRNDSGFNIAQGSPVNNSPIFSPGHGGANYPYGSGTLFVGPYSLTELTDGSVQPAPGGMEKFYVSMVLIINETSRKTIPVSALSGRLYLTVYIDKNKDQRFDLDDYEYVILNFT